MAKFLDTTGVSYHLQQLVNNANETLILISPYLKLNERLRQSLEDKDRLKIDIRLIYGKNELQPEQINWLRELNFVRTSFCNNLHAKCYLNEREAIVTSMNLYEYSQVNNQEMGIYISRDDDTELYNDIYNEARRLIRISDEVRVTVEKVPQSETSDVKLPVAAEPKEKKAVKAEDKQGFCIRCQKPIALNPAAPYCVECYKKWKRYENREYQEKYCHICGEEHTSSMEKPVCLACFRKHKVLFKATG